MSHDDQIQAVWFDPTVYDAVRHGPPYLPEAVGLKTASNELAGMYVTAHGSGPASWLAAILVMLKASSQIHQAHHWQTNGPSFFGDHLLFERLYNDSLPFIDQVAERAVGMADGSVVDPVKQASMVAHCVSVLHGGVEGEGADRMAAVSLNAEHQLLDATKLAKQTLEQMGSLSEGTDNLLQGMADKHEEFVYLLKQRVTGTAKYSYAR